jgi:hypothetical protein
MLGSVNMIETEFYSVSRTKKKIMWVWQDYMVVVIPIEDQGVSSW